MQERISIEEAIRESGLKKKYVANELGVSETYINEYLKKPGSISVKNASIICKLTNKKLNEIDFGEDVEINWYFFKFKLQKNWSLNTFDKNTTNDYHRKENSMQITVIRKSDNSVITRIFEDEEGIKEITDDDYEVLIEKDSN